MAHHGAIYRWNHETTLMIFTVGQDWIFHNGLYHVRMSNRGKKYLPKYKKLVRKLREARVEAGLTQVDAGKLLKKPQSYVSKVERGERGVDALELAEFAKVYKKQMDYFVG